MSTGAARLRTGFWQRPAGWKAVLLIVGYLAFYLVVAQLVSAVLGGGITQDKLVESPRNMVVALVLPIGIGALGLLAFTARLAWLGRVFGPQPVAGRRWMWVGPVVIVAVIAGHLGATRWSEWGAGQLAVLALAGLCIGVAEELATRGLAVKILRDAGHGEWLVAVGSSLLFAAMHTVNLLSGMSLKTVAVTVVYTFSFGMCMYLSMRVTGTLWTAVVLHAITDPKTILATGGVDQTLSDRGSNTGDTVALVATLLMMLVGLVAALAVRGSSTRQPV